MASLENILGNENPEQQQQELLSLMVIKSFLEENVHNNNYILSLLNCEIAEEDNSGKIHFGFEGAMTHIRRVMRNKKYDSNIYGNRVDSIIKKILEEAAKTAIAALIIQKTKEDLLQRDEFEKYIITLSYKLLASVIVNHGESDRACRVFESPEEENPIVKKMEAILDKYYNNRVSEIIDSMQSIRLGHYEYPVIDEAKALVRQLDTTVSKALDTIKENQRYVCKYVKYKDANGREQSFVARGLDAGLHMIEEDIMGVKENTDTNYQISLSYIYIVGALINKLYKSNIEEDLETLRKAIMIFKTADIDGRALFVLHRLKTEELNLLARDTMRIVASYIREVVTIKEPEIVDDNTHWIGQIPESWFDTEIYTAS